MQFLGSSPSTLPVTMMIFFCLPVHCTWHEKEGVDVEGISKEHVELSSLKKKQLVQVASSVQVQVTHWIDGSHAKRPSL
jgi:hypothetical protein